VEDETKLEPVTVSVKAEFPAIAGLGLKEEIAGSGSFICVPHCRGCAAPGPGGDHMFAPVGALSAGGAGHLPTGV